MNAAPSNRDFINRVAAGDAVAITSYYEQYFDLMFREAARVVGKDESACLDVVQEAMLKTLRSIKPADW